MSPAEVAQYCQATAPAHQGRRQHRNSIPPDAQFLIYRMR